MNTKCPECDGEMEEGLIADFIPAGATPPQWGTKLKWGGIRGVENKHEVKTYRCKSCGFLKSYAK
ncbi:hypothetical protein A2773_04465 [Candidatus Gottesmanbacteria bacterium RIFCSPHIGHO2_01_FULL_39_10]|uniref:DUF6487 domain-containing protein n=1 Tax=Candidatus Gottesmanbacteria bacterium RIFCSPHIGHO2_01_FULL_39_10 TaxID=1798375 RepID=A0A1F5ZS00_9BACT|nr:MAG: hypothetical protein A2773_04465 [Candidatus Gottesmanbacteria bacterium RIFCSPHIGHO2_01_FULL_39_10]